jgi:hypothetical protein
MLFANKNKIHNKTSARYIFYRQMRYYRFLITARGKEMSRVCVACTSCVPDGPLKKCTNQCQKSMGNSDKGVLIKLTCAFCITGSCILLTQLYQQVKT